MHKPIVPIAINLVIDLNMRENNMYKNKAYLEYFLATLLFTAVAFFALWDVLTIPNVSLTNSGDGLGGMSWLALQEDILNRSLYNYLFDDFVTNSKVGMGYMPSVVWWGTFWRVLLLPLVYLGIEPQNMYDILALIILALNGISGFMFARVLKAPLALSLFAGLLFIVMDNVAFRLQGHITMAATFGLLFQFSCVILAAQKSHPFHFALLGLTSWLSFQVSEYYGYYGAIATVIIFLGYFAMTAKEGVSHLRRLLTLLSHGLISALIFLPLMFLTYPTMITASLGLDADNVATIDRSAHDVANLEAFSVNNLAQLFDSYFWRFGDYGNPHEFTFRVGAFMPVAIFIFIVSNIYFERNGSIKQSLLSYSEITVFAVCGLILAAIGLHPDNPLSLSRSFFDIAPMF